MKKTNNKKGISLIVLVITIIVMIVLAAAIILSLSSSGVIGRANEAKTKSDVANAKQVVAMANAEWQLDEAKLRKEYGVDTFKDYANKKLNEAGYATSGNGGISLSDSGAINTIYVDKNDKQLTIPEGFTVSSVATEKTVEDGLVIKDEKGNEFVWIPVDYKESSDEDGNGYDDNFEKEFVRREGYVGPGGKLQSYISSGYGTEPYSYDTKITELNDKTGEYAEYAKMKTSVEKYGGFYIGRYEAGTTNQRKDMANGTSPDVLSQKDKFAYNYVGWGPSMTEVIGAVISSGKDQGKGAVELSRNMYKSSPSVVSTLCYGVQWDAALQFIATKDADYLVDSTGKGCYLSDAPQPTGYYAINNIYDMAGNMGEWTMETYYTYTHFIRGGGFSSRSDYMPASYRGTGGGATDAYSSLGFRVALYIK